MKIMPAQQEKVENNKLLNKIDWINNRIIAIFAILIMEMSRKKTHLINAILKLSVKLEKNTPRKFDIKPIILQLWDNINL